MVVCWDEGCCGVGRGDLLCRVVLCCVVVCCVVSRACDVVLCVLFILTLSFFYLYTLNQAAYEEDEEEKASYALHWSVLVNVCVLLHDLMGTKCGALLH